MVDGKRFVYGRAVAINSDDSLPCITDKEENKDYVKFIDVVDLLNSLNEDNEQLLKEKYYWKKQAMTLLMQVRRLTPRMTEKEIREFDKELGK